MVITGENLIRVSSMEKPSEQLRFPTAFNAGSQIQQLRVASQPSPISTLRRPLVQNTVPTVPKPVSGIRVTRAKIPGSDNYKVNVHFKRDPADTAFQSANVYLKQANGNTNIVGTTSATQSTFVVPKSPAASVVTVQSLGANTAVPIGNSPAKAISLS